LGARLLQNNADGWMDGRKEGWIKIDRQMVGFAQAYFRRPCTVLGMFDR
jgi:hypothetical protein